MPINIDQNVFRLDVSIYYIHVMKMLQSKQEFSKVEFCLILWKFLNFSQMEKHFSTCAKVHDKEKLSLGLKWPVELDDKWMV